MVRLKSYYESVYLFDFISKKYHLYPKPVPFFSFSFSPSINYYLILIIEYFVGYKFLWTNNQSSLNINININANIRYLLLNYLIIFNLIKSNNRINIYYLFRCINQIRLVDWFNFFECYCKFDLNYFSLIFLKDNKNFININAVK